MANRPAPAYGMHDHAIAATTFAGRLYTMSRSLPFRAAVIAAKLALVFAMSQKDAAFFYQQF